MIGKPEPPLQRPLTEVSVGNVGGVGGKTVDVVVVSAGRVGGRDEDVVVVSGSVVLMGVVG